MDGFGGFITPPGGWEWLLLLAVIVVIFAPTEGPKILRTIGQGIRDFTGAKDDVKRALGDEVTDLFGEDDEPPRRKRRRAIRDASEDKTK